MKAKLMPLDSIIWILCDCLTPIETHRLMQDIFIYYLKKTMEEFIDMKNNTKLGSS